MRDFLLLAERDQSVDGICTVVDPFMRSEFGARLAKQFSNVSPFHRSVLDLRWFPLFLFQVKSTLRQEVWGWPTLLFRLLSPERITRKDRYPLPLIHEALRSISQAKWFTRFDVLAAFHKIRIAEGDKWKNPPPDQQ